MLDFIVSEKVGEGGVGEYSSASLKDVLRRTYMEKSKLCAYSRDGKKKPPASNQQITDSVNDLTSRILLETQRTLSNENATNSASVG